MSNVNDFQQAFDGLKAILVPYAGRMELVEDTPLRYHLDTPYNQKWKKKMLFASVQIRKAYVSFYLIPVYMFPELLQDISPELKKHMHGKSCFNFKRSEPELFAELADLTRRGTQRASQEF